eukprot:407990_1
MEQHMKVFHGLGVVLHFEKFIAKFNAPISTTTKFKTAQQFSQGVGIILELKSGITSIGHVNKYLSVSWVSDFASENEMLFYGSYFEIINITEAENRKRHKSELEMLKKFQQTVSDEQIYQDIKWKQDMLGAIIKLIRMQQNYRPPFYRPSYSTGIYGSYKYDEIPTVDDEKSKSKYMTEYGKDLFNCVCRHENKTKVFVNNFKSLPVSLMNALFINNKKCLSVIPILMLFPYLTNIQLYQLGVDDMINDLSDYVNMILEYEAVIHNLYGRYLKEITFQSKPQNDNEENSKLKKVEHANLKEFQTNEWGVAYSVTKDKMHVLKFINKDKGKEEKIRQLQKELQRQEKKQAKLKRRTERLRQTKLQQQRMETRYMGNIDVAMISDIISPINIINRIDDGLEEYYRQLDREDYRNALGIGKFKEFALRHNFDDHKVYKQLDKGDCKICEFDVDEENLFPLFTPIEDEKAKNREIMRILCMIAVNGRFDVPRHVVLNLDIVENITQKQIDKAALKYSQQMSCLTNIAKKDENLRYFLAVSEKWKFPFLTYMIDSYTKDKATCYDNSKKTMSMNEWIRENNWMKVLSNKTKRAEQLQGAMMNYSNRLIQRLQFKPKFVIDDNLPQIARYIASMPVFIQKLMTRLGGKAPFQVELLFCVKGVRKNQLLTNESKDSDDDTNDDDKSSDDSDDSEDEKENPYIDHIGKIFSQSKTKDSEDDRFLWDMRHVQRRFLSQYNDLRTRNDQNQTKDFDGILYPQNTRFSFLVDRRAQPQEYNEEYKEYDDSEWVTDQITCFEPPDNCNTLPRNHVPEIGFDLIQKCLLKTQDKTITASDRLCGQLMTFMFMVERMDNIKCYVVWNGESMRFHGEHISQVLPNLFISSEENVKFKDSVQANKLGIIFNENTRDTKFETFYKGITNFETS